MEIIKIGQGDNLKAPLSPQDVLLDGLARVFVNSSNIIVSGNNLIGLTKEKNSVPCKILVVTKNGNVFDDGKIAYQGNTSLRYDTILKKGFTLDFDNKHRFQNWMRFDSFHLKGYYSDWMHVRDLICNRIIESMYRARTSGNIRPYMGYNDFAENDFSKNTDISAFCHIDGFPVELYINNSYWGLYSLNIKKSRDNYLLSKTNTNHIQVEAANDMTYTTSGLDWSKLEIRNPKSDSGNTKFEEGVEPNAGEVKTAWTAFIAFLTSITANTSKADIENHLNMREFIDSILFCNFIHDFDFWKKNTLYTTWDGGNHWSPLLYDMDISFGIHSIYGDVADPYNDDPFQYQADVMCPWLPILRTIYSREIETRYAELRDRGIFDYRFVQTLIEDFTREVGYDVYKRDIQRWPGYPSLGNPRGDGTPSNDFYESAARLSTFIRQRIGYLDGMYNYSV